MLLTLLSLHFPDHQVFIAVSAIPLSYRIGMNTCDAEPHFLIQNSTAIIALDELQLQLCNFLTLLRDANHFLILFPTGKSCDLCLQYLCRVLMRRLVGMPEHSAGGYGQRNVTHLTVAAGSDGIF